MIENTDARLQSLARSLVAGLYMLVRSVKLYDPDNAVFEKPLNALLETVNAILMKEGKLDLAVVEGNFYLNSQLVKVDQGSLENVRFLAAEFEARSVGGFNMTRRATLQELKNFVWIFAKDQTQEAGEDGLEGRKLATIKLARWRTIKEKLNRDIQGQVDRKRYQLTVYARLVVYVQAYLSALRGGTPLPRMAKAGRLVQDLVDVSHQHKSQFLGLTTTGDAERALAYHLVNTAMLAIAFGGELGLKRPQLKELALVALFARSHLWPLDPEHSFVLQPERLPEGPRARRGGLLRDGAQAVLSEPGASRLQYLTALSAVLADRVFGKPVRDARGRIKLVVAEGDLPMYQRILALCAYYDLLTSSTPQHAALGPAVALELMWSQQRFRFDPELLAAFARVMATQPIKLVGSGTVDLAGV